MNKKNKIQNIYDNPDFFSEYKNLRQNNGGFNDAIEQPAIRSLLPDLKNLHLLDIGCGLSDFARYAIQHGAASVLGIDPSSNMIGEAKKLTQDARIRFQQTAVEDFTSSVCAYDLIISSVAFHYVEDFNALIQKIVAWLKPQGYLVFSVEHPICTAYPEATIKTDEHGRAFHPVYNYRDERMFIQHWFVDNVQKYHRTISTYINALIDHGLTIEKILEPMPSDEMIAENKQFAMHKIRPPLLMIKAKKEHHANS